MKKLMTILLACVAAVAVNASGTSGANTGNGSRSGVNHSDIVRANETDVYNLYFRGGEEAIVIVSGDGDTDLDLYVYDENGNLIDSDTDRSDDCIVSWTPKWSGYFKIKIKNLGDVYNRYVLVTN